MRIREILVGVMLVLCGACSTDRHNALMIGSDGEPKKEIKTTSIIVAAMDVPRGTVLRPELLMNQDWPEAIHFATFQLADSPSPGRYRIRPLREGG